MIVYMVILALQNIGMSIIAHLSKFDLFFNGLEARAALHKGEMGAENQPKLFRIHLDIPW